jgi:hypothetical protein
MKKFNQFMSEAKGYGDVNRQVASAQDKVDRAQAKNVTTKGKKLGVLADPYSGKPTKQEVWEYKGKKWLVLGKSVEVFVPMKYHKVIKEDKYNPTGYHTVVDKPFFTKSDIAATSHDKKMRSELKTAQWMHSKSGDRENQLVTFEDEKIAKKYAKKHGSKIYVTSMNTFRLYKSGVTESIERIDEGFKQLKNIKNTHPEMVRFDQMKWYRKLVKQLKDSPGEEIVLTIEKPADSYRKTSGFGDSVSVRQQDISGIGLGKTKTEKLGGGGIRTTKVLAINENVRQIDELFGLGKKKKQKEKKEKLQTYKDNKSNDVSKYGIHRDHGIKNGQHIEFIWAYGKGASSKSSSKNTIIGKVIGQPPESDGDLYKVKVVKSNNPKIAVGKTINRVFYTQIVRVLSDKIAEDIANAAGGALGSNPSTGSIAGYDPMLSKKPLKRSKFAGTECFEVDNDTFQKCHTGHGKYERWDKYLKDDCDTCKNIRAYAKRHPQKDIVIQRASCGTMTYLKRKGIHY